MDRVLDCVLGDVHTGHDVMNAYLGENLRRIWSLLGFNFYFVAGNVLPLLAQDANHRKRRATRETEDHQFDWFRPGVARRVVDEEVVSASVAGDELLKSALRLSKGYAARYHVLLRIWTRRWLPSPSRPFAEPHG